MSELPAEVVAGPDILERFSPELKKLSTSYCCILAVGPDGHSRAKGSGIFVSIAAQKFLFTARHVVVDPLMAGTDTHLLIPPLGADGQPAYGEVAIPRLFQVNMGDIAWESEPLDVAAVRLPAGVCDAPGIAFLDGAANAATCAKVRRIWKSAASDTTSLPYVILGFPNFGHHEDLTSKTELLSALPLMVYVTQFEPDAWDGLGRTAPKLRLEIDAHKQVPPPPGMEGYFAELSRRLGDQGPEKPNPFGGYSGGPVVLIARDGEFLIGVITDGGSLYEFQFALASAWDDCVASFNRSL